MQKYLTLNQNVLDVIINKIINFLDSKRIIKMSKLKIKAAKTITVVTLITIGSKLLGFLRDALIAYHFGTGVISDSYFAVAGMTILLSELIIQTSLTATIPVFSQIEAEKGEKAKKDYIGKFITLIVGLTLIILIIGQVFAPWIVKIVAVGFSESQFILTSKLLRLALPGIIFSGIVGVMVGYLQSEGRFYISSANRIIFNLICILYLSFFSQNFGIEGMMLATVVASITQYLVMRYNLMLTGYHYKLSLSLKDQYIKQALALSIPVFLGIATYDINVILDRSFASTLLIGNVSQLTYAAKVEALIISIFISAIMTYFYPLLSQKNENSNSGDLKFYLARVVNLNLLVAIPATVILSAFAEPIVQILFERGEFQREATNITAMVLKFYSLGIIWKSLREAFVRIFYILQKNKQVLLNGVLTIVINLILNFIVISNKKVELLALTTSISIGISTIILIFKLRKLIGGIQVRSMLVCAFKSLMAALIMLVPTIFLYKLILYKVSLASNFILFLILILSTGIALLIYIRLIYLFKIKEAEEVLGTVFPKFKKKKSR